MKRFKRIVGILSLLMLTWFGATAFHIHIFSKDYSEQKSDVAIVLGASTIEGQPSPVFRERLKHAKYLYENDSVQFILVTGGISQYSEFSESHYGKSYLENLGIPSASILLERESQNTRSNIFNASNVMKANALNSALMVSDPLHMYRAMHFAKAAQMDARPSPTKTTRYISFSSKLKFLISETLFSMYAFSTGKYC